MKNVILGIETSCDECSAAVVENGTIILSNIVFSQIETHKLYGGVVPEIASREHVKMIDQVVRQAVKEAGLSLQDLSAVSVTQGPGLVGPLLIGISYAKSLAYGLGIPLLGVHHLHGHVVSVTLSRDLKPPFLALIVSGGHTHFYKVEALDRFELLAGTRDDALGEAFDKVARMLGLSYPGGPEVEKLAAKGKDLYHFPRTLLEEDSLDFSFSGLKSHVYQFIHKEKPRVEDVAASFQEAAFETVLKKIQRARKAVGDIPVVVVGGVSANKRLRQLLEENLEQVYFPPLHLCGDNGAMIAAAAYYLLEKGVTSPLDINALPNIALETVGNL